MPHKKSIEEMPEMEIRSSFLATLTRESGGPLQDAGAEIETMRRLGLSP